MSSKCQVCRWVAFSIAAGIIALFFGCDSWRSDPGEAKTYDAGPIFGDDSGLVNHTFKVTAKSKTLNIKNIIKSCNCTEVKLSARKIDPGDTADLTLNVKPGLGIGNWNVSCTLETDDPAEPERTYHVTYRTYPHVRIDSNTINLDSSKPGADGIPSPAKRVETWFEIYERTSKRADSFSTLEASQPLVVDIDRVPIVDQFDGGKITRSRYRLGVTLDPKSSDSEGASGLHSATIVAKTHLGRAASVTAIWSLILPLEISPNPVSFGIVKRTSEIVTREIRVRSMDGKPFRLLTISSGEDGIQGEDADNSSPTAMHLVRLDYKPKNSGISYPTGRIRITTDHPRMPKVTIPWSAILRD